MDKEWLEVVVKRSERECLIAKIIGVEEEPAVSKGQNYVSIVTRTKLDVVLGSGAKRTKSLIIKSELGGKKTEALGCLSPFKTETKMFRHVLPKMEQLMHENHDTNDIPWCKLIGYEEYSRLIFEDLTVAKRQDCIDFNHGILVLRSLGRLHAMSKVLMDRGAISEDDLGIFQLIVESPFLDNFTKCALDQLSSAMKSSWPEEWGEIAERIGAQAEDAPGKMRELAQQDHENDFKVVNHGDLWICNLMFKDYHDGTPISMRFIDFQLCHYGSYAWDVVYFMYTSLRPDIRRESYNEFLNAYWESLDSTLRQYGYEGSTPTFDDVKSRVESLDYFAFYAVSALHPFMTADSADALDIEEALESGGDAVIGSEALVSEKFIDRVGEDIKHFAEKGVI